MHLGPKVIGNFKPAREDRPRRKTPVEKRPGKHPEYLALIRQLPCCVCGKPAPSEPHHLKCGTRRGGALKAPDNETLPLCHDHHINGVERAGSRNEVAWFQRRGIEQPLTLATALFANRHSLDAMLAVLRAHMGEA